MSRVKWTCRSCTGRCCCGISTLRCSIRSSRTAASLTWTRTPPAARCRARDASTTPRSNGRSCSRATAPGRCRRSSRRWPRRCSAPARTPRRGCARCCWPVCSPRWRHERAAREAQEQTRDILKTVHEGFFLLDADYRIGSVWSEALTRMFSRQDFAGLSLEELLKDLVAPATLATATKYIKLLWGDRSHESLMKSINPLGQLEVTTDNGHGGKETRYLQFDFHRVMGPEGIRHVLCAVGDITSSVLLARELQDSQDNANTQVDMMLGMLHVDPLH